ncbi:sister chromatid cohesion protein Ctf8 [Talaromyces proteolyticus]|uniref:Sister chromatid cohesion protein Ctf8 n=1 Tax=Talaromyces proteolyticus TaxID=1131652 RepID=A0AAD4KPX5_9EURO|nr:sister chromatid cohesion protein Ctf8 [Talaromyces proteolyticus]KAH8697688.1 sister chromatid cohesion protein Ctf8 [Talaromyces proteolyticus]
MPSVPLFPPSQTRSSTELSHDASNPLPTILHTPSGLAILELQGTINVPPSDVTEQGNSSGPQHTDTVDALTPTGKIVETELGRLMFPDYVEGDTDNTKWMKRAYLFVGKYQRMTGEVKKLAKPLAIIRRRQQQQQQQSKTGSMVDEAQVGEREGGDELEIVEIIKYKIIFASRPEPVGI